MLNLKKKNPQRILGLWLRRHRMEKNKAAERGKTRAARIIVLVLHSAAVSVSEALNTLEDKQRVVLVPTA